MQGPSAIALRQGGQGGALKYKVGVQVVVSIQNGRATPPAWKKKTTLQEVFGDFGQVLEIHTQDDGTAIVEFEDKRDALDAAECMDGKTIAGVPVVVEVRQEGRVGTPGLTSGLDGRITEMAHKFQLDATSTARLVSAFRDRGRRGCNLDVDIKQLSDHLAASNKPSALVCMKLAELREGKPIGPCRYGASGGRERSDRGDDRGDDRAAGDRPGANDREVGDRSSRNSLGDRRGGDREDRRERVRTESRSDREHCRDRLRSRSRRRSGSPSYRRSQERDRDRGRDRDRRFNR